MQPKGEFLNYETAPRYGKLFLEGTVNRIKKNLLGVFCIDKHNLPIFLEITT